MGVNAREKPKGSGVWWVFINHQGKRKSKRIGDEKTALKVAEKVNAKLVLGDLSVMADDQQPKSKTFMELSEVWLEDYIKPLRRQSTYNRYKDMLKRYAYPELGDMPIDEIKRKDVKALLLKVNKKGLSRSMVALTRDVISGPMNYAIDEELIEANPTLGILKRLKLERDKQIKVEPLTRDEVELFLTTSKKHFPEYHAFFMCAFRTGMRLGEMLALTPGDLDLNGKFIRVNKAYRRGRLDKTKNGKPRRVDMSAQLEQTLREYLTSEKKKALKSGKGESEILFHRDGKYIEQNYIRRVYKRALKKAGIREIRIHDARHTYASLLLSNGESPVYVKEQLGHHSIKITVDIYGHWIPSSNRDAVNRLDTLHPTAPYTHPIETKKPQPVRIAANSF